MKRTKAKNANGLGSVRKRTVKRENGSVYTFWEARITVGAENGRQIQKTVTGKTQEEVIERMKAAERDHCAEAMTVCEWMEIWRTEYLNDVKPSTAYLYGRYVELYINPALGDYALPELHPEAVQRFCNGLSHPKDRQSKPLSPKTVKCIYGVLHEALQQAVINGRLYSNPSDSCRLPKTAKKEIQPLEDHQVTEFMEAISGHVHEYLYKIALFTGLREGELLGLTWDCVDFQKGTLTVKQQLRREQKAGGKYYFSSTKNGKTRTLTLAPSVLRLFRYQKQQQAFRAASAGDSWTDSGLVFTNQNGGTLSYRTVYDCFKRIVKQMGIPDMRFHDLRHSYAVISLRSGDDIKTVQENLGHATASFTLDVYGHVTEDMRKASADRLENYMKAVMNS